MTARHGIIEATSAGWPAARRAAAVSYAVLAILMTTSAFYPLFIDPESTAATAKARGSVLYTAIWLLLYAATAYVVVASIAARGVQRSFLSALPFAIVVLASGLWSVGPGSTLYFGLLFCANVLIAYALAQLFVPEALLSLLATVLAALLVVSLAAFVALPDLASTERWGGGWLTDRQLHGVFAHKSDAGYYFAMLYLVLVHGPAMRLSALFRAAIAALALLAIVLANSATALVGALVISGLLVLVRRLPAWRGSIMAAAAAAFVAGSVLMPYLDLGATAVLVGRDAELTGRAEIWRHASEFVAERPILGFGYYGFFDERTDSPVWRLWAHFQWFRTPHFHNSGIDVLISLGAVGLLLYLAALAMAYSAAWNPSLGLPSRDLLWAILLLLTLSAGFDFTLMRHNGFATTFLFYCLFTAAARFASQAVSRT